MKALVLILICMTQIVGHAQTLTQTLRGTVTDQDTKATLPAVRIDLVTADTIHQTMTDMDGNYRFENVPVGRVTLIVTYTGYENKRLSNLLINSGKELIMNIELVEAVQALGSVVVTATQKGEVQNDMSLSSARSFSVEETQRYAGAIDDPARMVSAFAGVNGNPEGNNDIVVRGNSSKGVLWMLEGVEIPNPNHFASEGSTGGPINALNSTMLGNSDFITGAFAPQYGNALSGVFDMSLRSGNNETREYSIGLSVLGSDVTVEGPFKNGYAGSYLANYRYSSLSLLDQAGLVDFDGVPKYQDGSFKLNLPISGKHKISVFGLGGKSSISQKEYETEAEERVVSEGVYGAYLGVLGLSHSYLINDKSYIKSSAVYTINGETGEYNLANAQDVFYDFERTELSRTNLKFLSTFNHKFNAKNHLKAGVILTNISYDMHYDLWSASSGSLEPLLREEGSTNMIQGFASWKYRASADLSFVSGIHYLQFMLNNRYSIEPRLAAKWQFRKTQSLTLGTGLHSKPESLPLYLAKDENTDKLPNENLDMAKAAHFTLGYDNMITPRTHFRAEVYYQHLFDVPVSAQPNSTVSMINSTYGFTTTNLINNGTGRNYGVELTLERFFHKGFYYMSTVSLYKSLYTANDGVERNSKFDGNYVVNVLGGKEFRLGKVEKKRILFTNVKVALIGGQRYTPIDLEASKLENLEVRDESQPYSVKADDVFKLDLAVGIRRNRTKTTTEFKIDVQNVTNNQAVVSEYYNPSTQKLVMSHQLPLLPVISYKLSF